MTDQKPKAHKLIHARGRGTSNPTREPALTHAELVSEDGQAFVVRLPRDGRSTKVHLTHLTRAEQSILATR